MRERGLKEESKNPSLLNWNNRHWTEEEAFDTSYQPLGHYSLSNSKINTVIEAACLAADHSIFANLEPNCVLTSPFNFIYMASATIKIVWKHVAESHNLTHLQV